jgi:hypothetical protein
MFLHTSDDENHRQKRFSIKNLFHIITAVLIIALIVASPQETMISANPLVDSLNSAGVIYFDFGKFKINPGSFAILNRLAEELKSDPGAKIEIIGHTDNIGSESFNDGLALKRAEEVQIFLFLRDVKSSQVTIRSEGYKNPASDNDIEEHRALNRRVEFRWIHTSLTHEKPRDEKDESFVNAGGKWQQKGNELIGEISVRDTTGEPITDVIEDDVKAELQWEDNGKKETADGTVKLFPIDDKKKIAFTFTMDYSPSMWDDHFEFNAPKTEKIIQMEKAVMTFIDKMDGNNFAKIVKFGMVIDQLSKFTKSKDQLRKYVSARCFPRAGTALYRSIYFSLSDTVYNSNPTIMKTVIAFTDGEENSSGKITKDSIYRNADNRGIRVFTVGLINDFNHSIPVGMNSRGEADLVEIAKRTGGFYYWAKDPSVLPLIYKQIYDQIMKSYNISIIWNGEKLPPKGTPVTAMLRINVKGMYRTIYKKYVME